MSQYVGPIKRVNRGRGHSYVDANGLKVPGVTTILKALPKDALINWAANATADAAVDRWDELAAMKPAARLAALKKARYEDRDTAANRGTEVHNAAQRYLEGDEIELPDDIAGHVESYISFVDDWQPEPLLVEAVIMSHRYGYAGTCDLGVEFADPAVIARLAEQLHMPQLLELDRPVRAIGDIKTSRSGIFPETAWQVCAYRYADVYVDADGDEQPMPEFDFAFALHIRADDYGMRPLVAGPEQLREFLYVREVQHAVTETSKSYVGDELTPGRRLKRRRLEVADTEPAPTTTRRRRSKETQPA
ncbi:MAG: hypothetical protein EPO40_02935 [Myxococcaceae bacterium]|nr:MAG: hypothetical protein EPO40_02935 [Myxococcaceae bacterium]